MKTRIKPAKKSLVVRLDGIREAVYLKRRRFATVLAGGVAIMLAYQVVFGHNGLTAFEAKRRDTQQLQVQLQSLQHENDLLRSHADRLQSDPSAIEHQAREELHYTRPGEVIYTLPPDPKVDPNAKIPPPRK